LRGYHLRLLAIAHRFWSTRVPRSAALLTVGSRTLALFATLKCWLHFAGLHSVARQRRTRFYVADCLPAAYRLPANPASWPGAAPTTPRCRSRRRQGTVEGGGAAAEQCDAHPDAVGVALRKGRSFLTRWSVRRGHPAAARRREAEGCASRSPPTRWRSAGTAGSTTGCQSRTQTRTARCCGTKEPSAMTAR